MDQSNTKNRSLRLAIDDMIKAHTTAINVSFPAKIQTYNRSTQLATIIPLTKEEFYMFGARGVDTEIKPLGEFPRTFEQEVPPIPDVPVQWPTANDGNSYVHMPLVKGDLGMCVVSTRSLENYMSTGWLVEGECTPIAHNDVRHHDLSDSWFIPGVLPKNKRLQLPDYVASDSMVIKNGDLVIEVGADGTVAINNSATNDFVDLLMDILGFIKDARYPTMMGLQNMAAIDRTVIANYLTLLETFKK